MTQALYGVLWTVTLLIAAMFAKWWKSHKDDEAVKAAFQELQEWAAIAVRAAKDLGDSKTEMTGAEKAEYAFGVLEEVRDKIGLDITDEQLMLLIRAAYTVMVDEQQAAQDYYLLEDEVDGE